MVIVEILPNRYNVYITRNKINLDYLAVNESVHVNTILDYWYIQQMLSCLSRSCSLSEMFVKNPIDTILLLNNLSIIKSRKHILNTLF